jgi:hypothetical protein
LQTIAQPVAGIGVRTLANNPKHPPPATFKPTDFDVSRQLDEVGMASLNDLLVENKRLSKNLKLAATAYKAQTAKQMTDRAFADTQLPHEPDVISVRGPLDEGTRIASRLEDAIASYIGDTMLRIVSDGTSHGTRVFSSNVQLTDILSVEILPVTIETGLVEARITFTKVELDITARLKEPANTTSPKPSIIK